MESTSEMETALQFYEAARDNLSLVRVYCYCGNLEKVSVTYSACQHQSLFGLSRARSEHPRSTKTRVKAGSWRLCRVYLDYPCEKEETVRTVL